MTENHVGLCLGGSLILALLLSGCQQDTPRNDADHVAQISEGAAAVWQLTDASEISTEADSIEVGVMRMQCSGGVTGETLAPAVDYEKTRIVVRIDVVPLEGDAYTCPSNDRVPVSVKLAEPIGDRMIVDGGCTHPDMVPNIYCESDVRWDVSAEVQ